MAWIGAQTSGGGMTTAAVVYVSFSIAWKGHRVRMIGRETLGDLLEYHRECQSLSKVGRS